MFLGTIISTLATCIWVEPYVLYKHVFKKSALSYAADFAAYTCITAAACIITAAAAGLITGAAAGHADALSPLPGLAARGALCLIIPNLIFAACYHRTDRFRYLAGLAGMILKRGRI